ncbi:MAG: DUF4854 domain-containing protein [Firmicutes bacterium]|nr:DUF4854 domain-containing protein [Bacillota bacterium]
MKKTAFVVIAMMALCLLLTGCGGEDASYYENLREVSWEGTELTILLGENKSTGCEWKTHPQDDSVIDYSLNRSFKLSGDQTLKGKAIGTLSAGFEGKGAGTTQIVCTTPVGWDGTGAGLSYIVTVTVNADGTIASAEGEEAEAPAQTGQGGTLEDFFNANPGELEDINESLNNNESYKDVMDFDVQVKDNTLSYVCTYKQTYSADEVAAMKPELERGIAEDTGGMRDSIAAMEKYSGVDGISVYLEYRNGDGSTICGGTIEKAE